MNDTPHVLKPSGVRDYFSHGECERFLVWSSSRSRTAALPARTRTLLEEKVLARGVAFEKDLWEKLKKSGRPCVDATKDVIGDVGKYFRDALQGHSEVFIYQMTLPSVQLDGVQTSRAYPDFLHVTRGQHDDRPLVKIIDAKSSEKLRTGHQAQLAMYCSILHTHNGDKYPFTISGDAAVWRPVQRGDVGSPVEGLDVVEDKVEMEMMYARVKALTQTFPSIAADPSWDLSSACLGCPFLTACRDEARGTVNALPLTAEAKRVVAKTCGTALQDLEDWWRRATPDEAAQLAPIVRAPLGSQHLPSVEAFRNGRAVCLRQATRELPQDESCQVVVTVHNDPLLDSLLAYGIRVDIDGSRKHTATGTDEASFIDELHHALSLADGLASQVYTLTNTDRTVLLSTLWRAALRDGPQQAKAMECITPLGSLEMLLDVGAFRDVLQGTEGVASFSLSHLKTAFVLLAVRLGIPASQLQGKTKEDIVKLICKKMGAASEDDLTAVVAEAARKLSHMARPVVSALAVVRRCYTLPHVGFSTDDEAIASMLHKEIRSMGREVAVEILDARRSGSERLLAVHMETRMGAAVEVVRKMKQDMKCIALPGSYASICEDWGVKDTLLKRMLSIKQNELLCEVEEKSADREVAAVVLRYTSGKQFEVVMGGEKMDVAETTFAKQLVARMGESFEPTTFPDLLYASQHAQYSRSWEKIDDACVGDVVIAGKTIGALGVKEYRIKDTGYALALLPRTGNLELQVGALYSVTPRVVDFNTAKAMAAIASSGSTLFTHLLQDGPESLPPCDPLEVVVDSKALSDSQLKALHHASSRRVQLLWGPPGTGKTHYLAHAIVGWLRAAERDGKSLRVMVTAFTKCAISEVVDRVGRVMEHCGASFELYEDYDKSKKQLRVWGSTGTKTVKKTGPRIAVGTTCWAAAGLDMLFDVVVIDEAGQMLAADCSIPVSHMVPDTGRLVLAGDFLQLPPIVRGDYPSVPDEARVDSSILLALLRDDRNRPVTNPLDITRLAALHSSVVQLTENRRSNATITALSSRLYGKTYHATDDDDGTQKTFAWEQRDADKALCPVLRALRGERGWAEGLLSVELELPFTNTLAVQQAEGRAIDALLAALRDFSPCADYVVLAPQNAQLRAIKGSLTNDVRLLCTVDKGQGQSCDVVVVGIAGVSNTSLLDLHRLNVAWTRARQLVVQVYRQGWSPGNASCVASCRAAFRHHVAFCKSSPLLKVTVDLSYNIASAEWVVPGASPLSCPD
eukprot:Sspe_Gene.21616::Locus_8113_Transcript_2_2_Confidence_0.667_Length_3901::g.21616::m.21616